MISIRGAITVSENTEQSILDASKEMLLEIEKKNDIIKENVVSMIFTSTDDLDMVAPSKAARELGYLNTGLLNFNELHVEDSLTMCIRVLIFYNSEDQQSDANHVYLKDAIKLRPDLF